MTDQGKRGCAARTCWDDYKEPDVTALYLERYLNYGLTREKPQSGGPMLNGWHNGKLADSVVRHARRLLAATVEVSEISFRTTERPWRHVWQERIPPDRPGNVPRLVH